MHIRNLITGTSPRVLHRNGNPPEWKHRWKEIVADFFAESQEPRGPCADLTILTWNNRREKTVLEQCLDRWGLSYITLGKNVPVWRNDMKVYLNAEALRGLKTRYVMALDSDDTIVVAPAADIIAEFESFGCDLLFSTEKNSCPDVPALTGFEQSIAESPYCHLNSGGWIGKTEACRDFFETCLTEHNRDIVAAQPTPQVFRDDQGRTRKTFRRLYPAARLDYRCQIFQSLFDVTLDGEVLITAGDRDRTPAAPPLNASLAS
jgi:hypothetical protein